MANTVQTHRKPLWLTLRLACVCGMLVGAMGNSYAEDDTEPLVLEVPEVPSTHEREDARPCDQIYLSEHWMLDATRERLEETLCRAALWLDGTAGKDGDVLAARRTRGRIEVSYYHSDFSGDEVRIRAKIRVELPVLRRRLSAFIGLDNDDEFVQGRSEGFALRSEFPSLGGDDEWLAGLGYSFPGSEAFKSDFRVGAKGLTDTTVFVQNRFRYLAYADDNDVLSLRETLFWTNQDGFGSTSGIDWMHVLSDKLLARWDNVGTVSQESEGLDWRSATLLYQELANDRALAYEAFIRGESRHVVPVREYGARLILRQPLFGKRLFLEFITGYTWPKIDPLAERDGSFGAGLGVELPFGPQNL